MTAAPVTILGCGMMTGVGLSAPASCAAIRARLDNFQETRFVSLGGDWIIGSEVPLPEPWRGTEKLARLLEGPLRECLDLVPTVHPRDIPLILCVAEEERPGRLDGLDDRLLARTCELLGAAFHADSRLVRYGQVGGAVALLQASRLIAERGHGHVIVAGVDSYLVAATLRAYDERERLLTGENSNGFIPGEAGAAVLIGPADGGEGLTCRGLGFATERATIGSDEPLRGDGMVEAFTAALAQAGLRMGEIGYRIADISGEQYGFKEAELATSRLLRDWHEFQDLWHPADAVGHTGAAAVPVMLGVVLTAAHKRYAAGDPVLALSSHDNGQRAAMVLTAEGPA
ncbi:MAG TPA: 3-oxoacyl-ACP synthase [Thermohalobaculum sp.]|nr:3-oxoacyl-ACP synthase [Thermohalobaculum sp.]